MTDCSKALDVEDTPIYDRSFKATSPGIYCSELCMQIKLDDANEQYSTQRGSARQDHEENELLPHNDDADHAASEENDELLIVLPLAVNKEGGYTSKMRRQVSSASCAACCHMSLIRHASVAWRLVRPLSA